MIWLLLACGSREPALTAQQGALAAWRRGEAALAAHDPVAAGRAFDEALVLQPDDPVLLAWKGKAAADSGDLDAAIVLIDRALELDPSFAVARYDRAAWLARRGHAEDAAVDLEIALRGGIDVLPRDVLDDPDFAPYADHPAFAAVLPQHVLNVAVDEPEGDVFRGSEFDVRFRVFGARSGPIDLTFGELSGPFALVAAFEDTAPSTDGPVRDLAFRFRATGAGEVRLGPVTVASGTRVVTLPALAIGAKAPPGREAPEEPAPTRLVTPSATLAGRAPPTAWRDGGALLVASSPGDLVAIDPPVAAVPTTAELRDHGTPKVVITRWDTAPAGAHVTVSRGGNVLLDVIE